MSRQPRGSGVATHTTNRAITQQSVSARMLSRRDTYTTMAGSPYFPLRTLYGTSRMNMAPGIPLRVIGAEHPAPQNALIAGGQGIVKRGQCL